MIDINKIWAATDGGRKIIEDLYPQSKESFVKKKNFRIRPDDKKASTSVFKDKSGAFWYVQDKGGGDNKAKNAISLIQDKLSCTYKEALQYIANKYTNGSVKSNYKDSSYPEPVIEKTTYTNEDYTVHAKPKLTEFELSVLGKDITQAICEKFNLVSLEYYCTKDGYKINSTDKFPIYYYDYGTFGKIYQPFSKEYRFLYTGKKPEDFLFFDNDTKKLFEKVKSSQSLEKEEKLKDIILCSGPSDAITVFAQGFRVCWMNSETAKLSDYDYGRLAWMSENIYCLPDIDQTGIKQALKLGMRFLNMRIIWLPDRLKTFRDWKGNFCKDVRDFFKYYQDPKYPNLCYYFKKIVETSLSLSFWNCEYLKTGKKYEINNEQLYAFLNANGYYTIDSKANKKEFVFIKITDNIVETISEKQIPDKIALHLVGFLKENLDYYDIKLINTVHRSDQVKLSSLTKLKRIEIDFRCYGPGYDHIFFRNSAIKITAKGIDQYKIQDTGHYVLKEKITDFDFTLQDPPFIIDYTETYKKALKDKTNDKISSFDKFSLQIKDTEFSIVKFLYNSGRVFWRKEEAGKVLTYDEAAEHELHFISKVMAIGFALYRYKEAGMPYFLYAMETEMGSLGTNRGGTGKSFLFSMIEKVRNLVTINGRRRDLMDDKHVFSQVVKDVTDFVYYDDLGEFVDLHIFLSAISGKMEIRPLFIDTYMLDYSDSPKLGGSSNHSVRNIDPSIRRRLWFLGFSDYYHHEDSANDIPERSLRSEFGKNLIQDFDKEEMNKFYSCMAWCLHYYLKFHEKVNPPIEAINQRNIQGLLGDEFLYWAEEYFNPDRLDRNINKIEAFEEFRSTLSDREAKFVKAAKFKQKLKLYAEYKGYIFNPVDLLITDTEIRREDIREKQDGKDIYCFHFRTKKPTSTIQEDEF